MQAIARQPHRAPDGTPLHYERHRPEQTALYRLVHLLERVVPLVPVRQWVLSLPIPLRLLLASQPYLVTPVLQVARRGAARWLRSRFGRRAQQGCAKTTVSSPPSARAHA